MTLRSELVNELEKAFTDEAYDGGMGALSEDEFAHLVRTLAATALAVFEKAHTPTDDEREALVAILEAPLDEESRGRTFSEMLADAILVRFGFCRSVVPEPSAESYAEFEDWEQEMFRHQPVLSMTDGAIVGCQCHLAHVFVKGEDWGTHLATIITSRIAAEPQGEPSEKRILVAVDAFMNSMMESEDGPSLVHKNMAAALRAAGGVR